MCNHVTKKPKVMSVTKKVGDIFGHVFSFTKGYEVNSHISIICNYVTKSLYVLRVINKHIHTRICARVRTRVRKGYIGDLVTWLLRLRRPLPSIGGAPWRR